MSVVIPSLNASLAQLKALADYIDLGSGNATFVFYSSEKPANTAVVVNNAAKLVTCTIPKPCFKEIGADYIELKPTDSATVIKNGTAIWARLFSANDEVVADFAVGADITLANPNLAEGGALNITSIKLSPYLGE